MAITAISSNAFLFIVILIINMGYYLHALVGNKNDMESFAGKYHHALSIYMGQNISIIPMTNDLFDEINGSNISNGVLKFEYLTENVEKEILKQIGSSKVGYVEAGYFGGLGGQIGIIWENEQRAINYEFGQNVINDVLKSFNVRSANNKDEFETLNLDRHRDTNDWIPE